MDTDLVLGTDEVRVVGTTLRVDATDSVVLGAAEMVTVSANAVSVAVADCMLDAAGRRGPQNRTRPRRALVHDFADGLSLNFNHDYPGGVTVYGPMTVLEKGVTIDVGEALKKTAAMVTTLQAVQEEMRKQTETISGLQTHLDELRARVDRLSSGQ